MTITTAGAGTVVVLANVEIETYHTVSNQEEVDLYLRDSSTDCTLDGTVLWSWHADSEPTGRYLDVVPLMNSYSVGSAGTYTYYINGRNFGDTTTADYFWSANLLVTFYPS